MSGVHTSTLTPSILHLPPNSNSMDQICVSQTQYANFTLKTEMNGCRTCSLCGNNGHNSRTCPEGDGGGTERGGGGTSIMLLGVRVRVREESSSSSSSFRKSVSMNNLSQYQYDQPTPTQDSGYASDDVVHPSDRCRGRKRGIPWTEEEHRLFLLGLQKVGKGDWRGISRNFVKTRTPTQVASHAQKYFLRRNNFNRRRRRSSLFDITPHTFTGSTMEDELVLSGHEAMPPPLPPPQPQKDSKPGNFPVKILPAKLPPAGVGGSDSNGVESTLKLSSSNSETKTSSSKIIRPIPMLPLSPYPKFARLNINERTPEEHLPLTLKLSTPHSEGQSAAAAAADSQSSGSFQTMSGGGDSIDIVSVA